MRELKSMKNETKMERKRKENVQRMTVDGAVFRDKKISER